MKSYRVIKRKYLNKNKFVVEKRFCGFLWWTKFLNKEFDTYTEAAQAIYNDAANIKDEIKEEVIADMVFTNIDPMDE